MRRTAWILTGATVIVGTITFLIGLGIVNQASQITGETVSVLVAQVDISQFTVIRRENVDSYFRKLELPAYYFNRLQGLVRPQDDLEGWVTMVPIAKDSVLVWGDAG